MVNVFLTGEIQVGKSTIINKFIKANSHLKIGGFKTISYYDNKVYIMGVNDSVFKIDNCVGDKSTRQGFFNKFDTLGVELLSDFTKYDLIIMDEIGFMESKASKFRQAIMDVLKSEVDVLGVVKPINKGLPLEVKKDSKILTVDLKNHNEVYDELIAIFKKY